ncbi:MAG TPA: DUF2283 domain-containing protein [Acetobacteraceae bacterium]|jgi:uncharacterized protein YuzE
MKTHYDAVADAFYVRFADAPIEDSEEIAPGVIFDFDADHRLVAIELLDARAKLASGALPAAAE